MSVRFTTATGQEVELTTEDIMRAHRMMQTSPKVDDFHHRVMERNAAFLKKATQNVQSIAERNNYSDVKTEMDMKDLLSAMLGASGDIGDLIVEIIEQRIGEHHKMIYSE